MFETEEDARQERQNAFEKEVDELLRRWSHEFCGRMNGAVDDNEKAVLAAAYISSCISFFRIAAFRLRTENLMYLINEFSEEMNKELMRRDQIK